MNDDKKLLTKQQRDALRDGCRAIIRAEAIKQKVLPLVALAFARVESNFDPSLEGDLKWHLNLSRFEAEVPKNSPYKSIPELWHSYGLFQLLAPFHLRQDEHPHVLLDPRINAERALRRIRTLDQMHASDLDKMRLHYVFGRHDPKSPRVERVLERWHEALHREQEIEKDDEGVA